VREARGSADPADVLFIRARSIALPWQYRDAMLALADEHDRSESAMRAAFRSFRVDLARQVRTGSIDLVLLNTGREAAITALQAHEHDEISVIDRLHALLLPQERAELVGNIRAASSVQLTAAEVPRRASAEPQPVNEREARIARVVGQFGNDVFSAQSALTLPGSSPADAARMRLRNQAAHAAQLVPTLSKDERAKLADHIEATPDPVEE
jgi:hypothetical protein